MASGNLKDLVLNFALKKFLQVKNILYKKRILIRSNPGHINSHLCQNSFISYQQFNKEWISFHSNYND